MKLTLYFKHTNKSPKEWRETLCSNVKQTTQNAGAQLKHHSDFQQLYLIILHSLTDFPNNYSDCLRTTVCILNLDQKVDERGIWLHYCVDAVDFAGQRTIQFLVALRCVHSWCKGMCYVRSLFQEMNCLERSFWSFPLKRQSLTFHVYSVQPLFNKNVQ